VTPSSGPSAAGRGSRSSRGTAVTPTGERVAATSGRRVVVLVSGAGSNLAALLAAHTDAVYGARIVGVVSDNPDAGGLDMARDAGVPTAVVAPRDFPDRAAWDRGLAQAVDVFGAELVVSAGFMRILGAAFLERFPSRVVNTHPALLPSFPGAHGVRDALAYGVAITGCTLHVVDAGVDTGPIIAQAAVPVLPDDDEATLHERIKVAERALLVDWVGRIARGSLRVDGRRVTVA
jgi:phosphoribosylglycinamide formyltransferase-1